MKRRLSVRHKPIPLYKLLLRYLALNPGWQKIDRILDVWSKDRNEGEGYTSRHIRRILNNMFDRNCVERGKYPTEKKGYDPHKWRITEQGKKAACKLWDDLEYDKRTEQVRSV